MLAVLRVVLSEARRRWASWLALMILVALVGGAVLAGASAARRTEAAFPDYLARYGYDAEFYSSSPAVTAEVARWSDIRKLAAAPFYISDNGSVYPDGVVRGNGQYLSSNSVVVLPMTLALQSQLALVASGRAPSGVDDVDVGYEMQQIFHLHVGSVIVLPFYRASQAGEVFASAGTPPALGPTERFKVVGIAASAQDFPGASPTDTIYVSPAFERALGGRIVGGAFAMVRLKHGAAQLPRFTFAANHLAVGNGFVGAQGLDDDAAAIEGSIHPQVVGWWIFALLAGLAGLALVGQALSRQSLVASQIHPNLSALGVRPAQLFAVGFARAAAVGVAGTAGALAIATAVSPLTPVGEARVAEPSNGIMVDPVVFGLGGLATVAVVVLLGCWPAWRDAQILRLQRREARLVGAGASRVAAAAARTGAPPTVVIGVRHALERGRGRASVPVATALIGTIVAVTALVGTSVFGSSLGALLTTPRLYGQDFQAVLYSLSGAQVRDVASQISADPAVEGVSYSLAKVITVNGVTVNSSIAVAAKGPLVLSVADGRDPTGPHEIALGTQTMRAAGATVGSLVSVKVINQLGTTRSARMRVTGAMVFAPSVSNGGGLGVGAVVMLPAALDVVCGTGSPSHRCRASVVQKIFSPENFSWGMAVRVVPGAPGRAVVTMIDRRLAADVAVLAVPTDLVNFGQAVNFPLLLGAALALFGIATLAHLLFASASRRRFEFALLKVLGFRRGQVRASVAWQATTVAVVGVLLGVPIGLAVGNFVWRAFASNLGAVPLTVVSVNVIFGIVAGVVVASVALAIVPASIAARTRPALALRGE
jgi:ABC-type lipoprotein release transport system permease subunit